jgi:DNA-binding XRE family transcriptional regulator
LAKVHQCKVIAPGLFVFWRFPIQDSSSGSNFSFVLFRSGQCSLQKCDFLELRASGQGASVWEAKMGKKPISFRERMNLARPDVLARQKRNRRKSAIAIQLRVLRDAQGMTQADVAQATGMTIQYIERMESLVGLLPSIEDLERFAVVCGGRIEVVISPDKSDRLTDTSDNSSWE